MTPPTHPLPASGRSAELSAKSRLIVALDVDSVADTQRLIQSIGESVCFYKVGLQLFAREGPGIVRDLTSSGKKVFLDLKFHDIPNTVAGAVKSAASLQVHMLTVHASGGAKMLRAAAEAAGSSETKPIVLAVTVLTSLDSEELAQVGQTPDPQSQVLRLAKLAEAAGCGGVVASAQELVALRRSIPPKMWIVTPGIRPAAGDRGDQSRVATASEAITAGADYLVVGRPITAAPDPAVAAGSLIREIETALTRRM